VPSLRGGRPRLGPDPDQDRRRRRGGAASLHQRRDRYPGQVLWARAKRRTPWKCSIRIASPGASSEWADVLTLVERAQSTSTRSSDQDGREAAQRTASPCRTCSSRWSRSGRWRRLGPDHRDDPGAVGWRRRPRLRSIGRSQARRGIIRSMTTRSGRIRTYSTAPGGGASRAARGRDSRTEPALKQFGDVQKMMKQLSGGKLGRGYPACSAGLGEVPHGRDESR